MFVLNASTSYMATVHKAKHLSPSSVSMPGRARSVKRFERSNGLDIALYGSTASRYIKTTFFLPFYNYFIENLTVK